MPIHNYLRPLWRNGPHVVEDASPKVHTAFELIFRAGRPPGRRTDELVQLHRVGPLDVCVAWLSAEIDIPVAGTGFSYRRARYLHAFAIEGDASRELTPRRARAHFEDVYGEDLLAGIRAAEEVLIALEHPAEQDAVRSFFVTGSRRVPRREPVLASPIRALETAPRARAPRPVEAPPRAPHRPSQTAVQVPRVLEPAPASAFEAVGTAEVEISIPAVAARSDVDAAVAPADRALPLADTTVLRVADTAVLPAANTAALPMADTTVLPMTDTTVLPMTDRAAHPPADDVTLPLVDGPVSLNDADEAPTSASLSVLLRARLSRPRVAATPARAGEVRV